MTKSSQELVSVVIPTYNRQYCLSRAIASVLAQTYPSIELIVIDDGSEDGTFHYIKQQYPTVQIFKQENKGVSAARNLGVKIARGKWLAFLDSDDEWKKDKINLQIQALNKIPSYRLCHTDEIWIRDGRRVNQMQKHQKMGGWLFQPSLHLCLISPSSIVMERSLFLEVEGFDEGLPACEDYDLWLRISANHQVLYLDQPLTIKYGGHLDQLSKKYWGMDRFRIQSLVKILNQNKLHLSDRQAALEVLCKKIKVYLAGASKRQKLLEIEYYEQLFQQYFAEFNQYS